MMDQRQAAFSLKTTFNPKVILVTIVLLKQCSYWEVYVEESAHKSPWL